MEGNVVVHPDSAVTFGRTRQKMMTDRCHGKSAGARSDVILAILSGRDHLDNPCN